MPTSERSPERPTRWRADVFAGDWCVQDEVTDAIIVVSSDGPISEQRCRQIVREHNALVDLWERCQELGSHTWMHEAEFEVRVSDALGLAPTTEGTT